VALGVFIGCQPFYGFHLLICWGVGWLLGLNRLKLYLAANISNPFVAPFLIFAELQVGSYLRRGRFQPLTVDAVRATGVTTLGLDLLLGGVVIGALLAALAAWGTYATLGRRRGDPHFVELVRRAADRYVGMSITAWEFARGKLRNDPVYRAAIVEGLLDEPPVDGGGAPPRQDSVLTDVGCGQGLMLALLAEVRSEVRSGRWPGSAPRLFESMIGIELRPRVAAYACAALGDDARIVAVDARHADLPPADVVLLFDVLHLMPVADQESTLRALVASLRPQGVIVIREADTAAGWRFACVRIGNWLKAVGVGRWRQTFHFRSSQEWLDLFGRLGLSAEVRRMGQGTPFGNVLFRVTATLRTSRPAPSSSGRSDTTALDAGAPAAPIRWRTAAWPPEPPAPAGPRATRRSVFPAEC
jgi:SAM-dependent methyltransferase